jgi:hypothetical protein
MAFQLWLRPEVYYFELHNPSLTKFEHFLYFDLILIYLSVHFEECQ